MMVNDDDGRVVVRMVPFYSHFVCLFTCRMNMHYQSSTSQLGMAKDLQQHPQNLLKINNMNTIFQFE